MRRAWLETRVEVPAESAEAVANYLVELGSPGLASEEGAERIALVAYFEHDGPLEDLRRYLAELALAPEAAIATRWITDANWAENWKQHFTPIAVGRRLYVCPPWSATPPPGRVAVVIDPGMAFGTGHHATTRGCLELLERHVPAACSAALDVGTGSGVLAIALARLGVPRVIAVDTDACARAAAAENITRNHVAAAIAIVPSLEEVAGGPFPLVLANLQLDTLCALAARLTAVTEPGSVLIASGLLGPETPAFRRAYAAWTESERIEDGEWTSLALRRRP